MARRKISTATHGEKVATVYRDPEWGEFVVVLKGRPKADYFTSDRADAIETSKRMVLEGMRRRRMAKRSKLGAAARACKGKRKGAFRACIRKKMKTGRRKR